MFLQRLFKGRSGFGERQDLCIDICLQIFGALKVRVGQGFRLFQRLGPKRGLLCQIGNGRVLLGQFGDKVLSVPNQSLMLNSTGFHFGAQVRGRLQCGTFAILGSLQPVIQGRERCVQICHAV